ncbi:MAG: hypothetical protein JWO79_4835 [Actinomycetia bacterium]|nr:hypothetical protein [Actinomycetes bacterium]
MSLFRRTRRSQDPHEAPSPAPPVPLDQALLAAGDGGRESIAVLAGLLLDLEAAGESDAALEVLAGAPRVVVRADTAARGYLVPNWATIAADRLTSSTAGPLGTALASLHKQGRVREAAVEAMTRAPIPAFVPFLVVRGADWVPVVRYRARGALAELLDADPRTYLPVAAPIAALVGRRTRGRPVAAQVTATVYGAPDALLRDLAGSAGATLAIPALHAAVARNLLRPAELAAIANRVRSAPVARAAAEYAARAAIWTGRHAVLESLAGSRTASVRALGLTGYVRAGLPDRAAGSLADPAATVRALARDAARRASIDILSWYRAAVAADPVAPGALLGLAECGTAADAELLYSRIADASPRIRRAAVQGLRILDAADPGRLSGVLADPSGAVVREAVKALRANADAVPADLLWAQLGSPELIHRRAAYILLARQAGTAPLHAALLISEDSDPVLARRGRADAARLSTGHEEARAALAPQAGPVSAPGS